MNVLYIKNMVCNRCIKVVKSELENLGIAVKSISLGEVVTDELVKELPIKIISEVLIQNGFELIEDQKAIIVEKIKSYLIKIIHNHQKVIEENHKFSILIKNELGMDYNYLSSLFSSVESITIEQFIIFQKIERAKEFLRYGNLTLSEIAYKLGYSSVQHLSNQFKNITGFTASQFKSHTINMRKPIDSIY